MTYSEAFYIIANELQPLYDAQEAAAIGHEVLQHITGAGRLQRLMEKGNVFTEQQLAQFEAIKAALRKGEPMQYVLGIAWFMGRAFKVNEYTLIPRPETEELVQWIIDEHADKHISILDIGTGSGCIPVSLKLALPMAQVDACDISTGALATANENAHSLGARVEMLQLDFLDKSQTDGLPVYDVLVSNPPYIPIAEKEGLHNNVKDYEPEQALFVPDGDPVLFYRAIALFGKGHLKEGGRIYCELHRDYAPQTKMLFEEAGYRSVTLRKDMNGNERMVKAVL